MYTDALERQEFHLSDAITAQSASRRKLQTALARILTFIIFGVSWPLSLRAQNPNYILAQITSGTTDHHTPSINSKGEIVWSQLDPLNHLSQGRPVYSSAGFRALHF